MNSDLSAMRTALQAELAAEGRRQPGTVTAVAEPESAVRYPVKPAIRFSQSIIWDLQRAYFDQAGKQAWAEGTVPHYVTSNNVMARTYAEVLEGFVLDCQRSKLSGPVTIVELGAGSGQFSFHCLRNLVARFPDMVKGKLPFRYVLTDFTASNVNFWLQHPAFQEWRALGLVDFAQFDAVLDSSLTLRHSGATITTKKPATAIAVIANYLWDSIPQDYFKIEDGKVFEVRVALQSQVAQPDLTDPRILSQLEPQYSFVAARKSYYKNTLLDALLEGYRTDFPLAVVPFPFQGIGCMERLGALTKGPVLMLSADKGFANPEELAKAYLPGITHHGSFSLSVNFDAFRRYFVRSKGSFWTSGRDGSSITIVGGILRRTVKFDPMSTQLAFGRAVQEYGPDDYFQLKKGMERNFGVMEPDELLGYLRGTGYDPKAARRIIEALRPRQAGMTASLATQYTQALRLAWENFYDIGEDFDLALLFGSVLSMWEEHEMATYFLLHSLRQQPDAVHPLVLLGHSWFHLGVIDETRACLAHIERTSPRDERATALRDLLAHLDPQ